MAYANKNQLKHSTPSYSISQEHRQLAQHSVKSPFDRSSANLASVGDSSSRSLQQQEPQQQQQQQQQQQPQQERTDHQEAIRTIQGDCVRLTIVKPPSQPPGRPPCVYKIRTTQKYKQQAAATAAMQGGSGGGGGGGGGGGAFSGSKERDTQTRDTQCTVHTGLASKLERIMENQLVKYPYPLAVKCEIFLDKYPTVLGTYSLESTLGVELIEELMSHLRWQDRSKVNQVAITKRSHHLVWRYGYAGWAANMTAAAYPEDSILSRINCRIRMSSKCGLYKLLWMNRSPHAPDELQMNAMLPKSYLLHPMSDEFRREIQRPGTTWILKPSNSSQGSELKLYRSSGDLKEFATLVQEQFKNFNAGDILVQKYIDDPLLVDKRKFDLRVFLLVVPHQEKNTLFAFYHPGYVRLTCRRYEKDSTTLTVHLTNQALQKRDPRYQRVKETTTWSPGELNCYFNKRHRELGICLDWVHNRLHPRIKAILGYIVSLMNGMEIRGRRCFEIFGCDFLIDSRMQVWLIDINSSPSLATHTEVLKRLMPGVIQEAVGLALEVVYKSQKFKFIYPLVFQNNYSLIFDGQTSTSLY